MWTEHDFFCVDVMPWTRRLSKNYADALSGDAGPGRQADDQASVRIGKPIVGRRWHRSH